MALEEKDVFLNHRDTVNIKTGKHCRGITIKQYSSGVHPEPMFSGRGSDTEVMKIEVPEQLQRFQSKTF